MNKTRRGNKWIAALMIGAMVAGLPAALLARDRGFNQPGAAGNVGGVGPGRGSRRQPARGGRECRQRSRASTARGGSETSGAWDRALDPGANLARGGRECR